MPIFQRLARAPIITFTNDRKKTPHFRQILAKVAIIYVKINYIGRRNSIA